MKKTIAWAALSVCLAAPSGMAQLLADPASKLEVGWMEAGGRVAYGRTKYDDGIKVDRAILGVDAAYGIGTWVDAYAGLGFIANADLEGWGDSGDGFVFGAGARGIIYGAESFCIMGYGELRYLVEDYGEVSEFDGDDDVSAEVDASLFELAGGVAARYWLDRRFSVYGALELVPFSDGTAELKVRGDDEETIEADLERSNFFGVRVGAAYDLGQVILRFESAFFHELTTTISAGVRF